LDIKLTSNINKEKIENKPKNHFLKRKESPLLAHKLSSAMADSSLFHQKRGLEKLGYNRSHGP
jgi:hypothetical protein